MKNDEPNNEQKQTQPDPNGRTPGSSVVRDSSYDKKSEQVANASNKNVPVCPKSPWTKPIVFQLIFDAILVLATSTYAVFAIKQWCTMQCFWQVGLAHFGGLIWPTLGR